MIKTEKLTWKIKNKLENEESKFGLSLRYSIL